MNPFGPLEDYRLRPIPDQAGPRLRKVGFRAHLINVAAEGFAEPLEDARGIGIAGENAYYSSRTPPYYRQIDGAVEGLFLRRGVTARLLAVNARLAGAGLELFLFDGWRPRAVQAYFHDVWMPQHLAEKQPGLEGAQLLAEVEKYWSAPSGTGDKNSPAPHATGGATDLTLRWRDGAPLWMGSLFDDVTAIARRDHFERGDDLSFSDFEARANRRLLHWVMAEEGFIGHPDEWWHFSFGDQLWARLGGFEAALYGLSSPP